MGMLSVNNTPSLGTAAQLCLGPGAIWISWCYWLTLIIGDIINREQLR